MYFLDPKKKRYHTIRLFTGYALVAIAIGLTSATLVYFAYGYKVTRNGDLVQKGLMFVSSQPSGAQVQLNGTRVGATNTKLNLNAGKYDVQLSRDGYHNWHRTVQVEGGDVNHFVYPFLFPKDLKTTSIKDMETTPGLTTQSPDRRWLVTHQAARDETQFEYFDLNRNQETVGQSETFSISKELLSDASQPGTWELLEWSSNNRHMLFKRTYTANAAQDAEYILVDRQRPEGSYNLSRELKVDAKNVALTLFDKKPDTYYLHTPATGELVSAKLNSEERTAVLREVIAFKPHGKDMIVYTTKKDADEGKVTARLHTNDKEYTLRQLKEGDVYLLDAARFSGDWYVVISSQAEGRAFVYENPVDQIQDSKDKKAGALFSLRVPNPSHVSFSANAQYIALQGGSAFHVYDIDREFAYRYDVQSPLDQPQKFATWMDGDRLTYASNGKQIVFDYDSVNKRTLVPSSATYAAAFDRDYKYLYTFAPKGETGLSLQATPLRTDSDL